MIFTLYSISTHITQRSLPLLHILCCAMHNNSASKNQSKQRHVKIRTKNIRACEFHPNESLEDEVELDGTHEAAAVSHLISVPPSRQEGSWDVYAPWDSSKVMAPKKRFCLHCDAGSWLHRPLPDDPSLTAFAAWYVAYSWQQGSELWKYINYSAWWWIVISVFVYRLSKSIVFICVAWNLKLVPRTTCAVLTSILVK